MTNEYDKVDWKLMPVPVYAFDYATVSLSDDAYIHDVFLFRRPGINLRARDIPYKEMGLTDLPRDRAGQLVREINDMITSYKLLGAKYTGDFFDH